MFSIKKKVNKKQHRSKYISPNLNSYGYESKPENESGVRQTPKHAEVCNLRFRRGELLTRPVGLKFKTPFPQHKLTMTILVCGWISYGRKQKKELKRFAATVLGRRWVPL